MGRISSLVFVSLVLLAPASLVSAPADGDQPGVAKTPLSTILKPDGSLDLTKGFSGGLDVRGFKMVTAANGEPRFVPVASGGDIKAGADAGAMPPAMASSPNDVNWDNRFEKPGMSQGSDPGEPDVYAAAADGSGNVYAGGLFKFAGVTAANCIAKWNGTSWSALGSGMSGSETVTPIVRAIAVSGTNVFAGGTFTTAGGVSVSNIAKWDGTSWSALGTGVDGTVNALAAIGSDVFVGGTFTTAGGLSVSNIAKWDGTSWSALGTGVDGTVSALAASGGSVFAGGTFATAGGVSVGNIAKWDGSSWSALETGVEGQVSALAVSGGNVYAGGEFTSASGVAASNIAMWDGTAWSALGSGTNSRVSGLAVSGSSVFAGGEFTMAGGAGANYIARWNGTSWSAMEAGMGGAALPYVETLVVSGSDLFAGGRFITANGLAVNKIARWTGGSWSALGKRGSTVPSSQPWSCMATRSTWAVVSMRRVA